jgi:hypothetical protein
MSTEGKYNVTSDDPNFDTDAFIDGMMAQPLTVQTPEFYDGQTHCVVNGSIVSIASLTAAAPEMLEALEALVSFQENNETEYLGMEQIRAYMKAKIAIAKAKGESHE